MAPGDDHRVLAVEADARPGRRLAVDVLVLVDEHAIRRRRGARRELELLAQLGVGVPPGVARQAALARRPDPARAPSSRAPPRRPSRRREQELRMAGDLRLRHREPHVGEQSARPPLADMSLRLLVGLRRRRSDHVDAELLGEAFELGAGHARIVPVPRRRPVELLPNAALDEPPRMHVLFDLMAALNVSDTYVQEFLGDPKLAESYGLLSLIGAAKAITTTEVAARLGTAVTTASDRIRRLEERGLRRAPAEPGGRTLASRLAHARWSGGLREHMAGVARRCRRARGRARRSVVAGRRCDPRARPGHARCICPPALAGQLVRISC